MITFYTTGFDDFPLVKPFYEKIYRPGHPLRQESFFQWQYGFPDHGFAIVALDGNAVVGHLGCSISDGIGWLINLYVEEAYRDKMVTQALYSQMRKLGIPLASTNVNELALHLYRRMRWYRYADLVRLVKVKPGCEHQHPDTLLEPATALDLPKPGGLHYWNQPGLQGVLLPDGSAGVQQPEVGGIRLVDIKKTGTAEFIFSNGFGWCDYVTSWNDMKIDQLLAEGWQPDTESNVPWLLNPPAMESRCKVSLVSEKPLLRDFVVRRFHSDHGRVASLNS